MKNKKIVLGLSSLSLLLLSSSFMVVSCSKNEPEKPQNQVIEDINKLNSENKIKPIKNSFTQDELNKINSSNVLDYVSFESSNINKKDLRIIDFNKNESTITFRIEHNGVRSNLITLKIRVEQPNPIPPSTDWNQIIANEKTKWNNYVFAQQTLTQNEIDNIRNNQIQEIEFIVEKANLMDVDHFSYGFNITNVTDTVVFFDVLITPDEFDKYPEFSISKEFNYVVKQEGQDQLQEVVDKLNKIDWNNFNYSKFSNANLVFRDLSNIVYANGYVLNFINNFDPNAFSKENNVSLKIGDLSFKLDILKQILKFKITISKDGKSIETNEYTLTYKTPKNQLSALDGNDNTDQDVKVTNSSKGILTLLPSKLEQLSSSLFTSRYNKFFNTASSEMNKQFKYLEMLYQARFIFYQSFGDNATSIDYGIENNRVIFKAKIKDTITIASPYIQVLNDTNNLSNLTLNKGEIITITLTPSNINDTWETINNDSGLGGGSTPFLYGKGPERDVIASGNRLISFGQNLKEWNMSINVNQRSIINQRIIWRIMFCFCVPCIKK